MMINIIYSKKYNDNDNDTIKNTLKRKISNDFLSISWHVT